VINSGFDAISPAACSGGHVVPPRKTHFERFRPKKLPTKQKMSSQPSASIAPPVISSLRPPRSSAEAPPPLDLGGVLIAFGLLFYWVITQHQKSQAAAMGGGGRRGMLAGVPVPVVPATSKTGSLGIYLPAIGTVTSVYTDSITAQVTGVIAEVHYREARW